MTKKDYHDTIGTLLKQKTKKRLTKAALETLAIVAYRQPMTKVEVEQIRGVNSDYSIQKLLEKELVTIVGRSEKPGRPLLYATSPKFMDYFGIQSLKDLPRVKDFQEEEVNEIGEPQDIEVAEA
jgi:segregation and condensation protein B